MRALKKNFKKLIQEVLNLIINFFRPYGISDEMLTIPNKINKMGLKVQIIGLINTLLSLTFAFFLKISNILIEAKLILLGIIVFMLYRAQQLVRVSFYIFESSENKKFDLIFKDEACFRASQIICKTSDKVLKYDKKINCYKIAKNEEVINSIKYYLESLWKQKIQHKFDVIEILSIICMLVGAIITNTAIPQAIFIPLIIVFVIISFLSSAYIGLNREIYYKKNKECDDEQSLIINDLLRIPTIVKGDLDMRISKLQKTLNLSNQNVSKFHKKVNLSRFFVTIIEAFSQYGIIILYLLGIDWSSINLGTLTQITATLVIVETALKQISKFSTILINHDERLTTIKKEEENMAIIMKIYNNVTKEVSINKVVDNIVINPFSINYIEESENDKPFTLKSNNKIIIDKGNVAILYGPSGSGKSTFMKMLTERIKLEKTTDIPETSRYLFYDETLKFGNLSIFEELFCGDENPDLKKMQEILENLHLWCELKANCFDVWKWMKEKQFSYSLSNGQKQRLIISKILYWLDDEIDVLVLDECTSNLDFAKSFASNIVKYANKDKKRIIIISTHQNIDEFKSRLADKVIFKNLVFSKNGDTNLIKEI